MSIIVDGSAVESGNNHGTGGYVKAMGNSNSYILVIFLFKAFILGLIGRIAGFFTGKSS